MLIFFGSTSSSIWAAYWLEAFWISIFLLSPIKWPWSIFGAGGFPMKKLPWCSDSGSKVNIILFSWLLPIRIRHHDDALWSSTPAQHCGDRFRSLLHFRERHCSCEVPQRLLFNSSMVPQLVVRAQPIRSAKASSCRFLPGAGSSFSLIYIDLNYVPDWYNCHN